MIPLYRPYFDKRESKYLNEAIDSGWVSATGPFVRQFEEKFANYIGSKYAIAVSNGTSALEACLSYFNQNGLKCVIPSSCYIAVPNSIINSFGSYYDVDVKLDTMNMDCSNVAEMATLDKDINTLVYVYNYGNLDFIEDILNICREKKLWFLEDACEAFGSQYKGKFIGTFGDAGVFSFFGNKTITTGEGGMIVTNDKTMYDYLILYRSHGINSKTSPIDRYNHKILGKNLRMTNIQAAIGLAQLEKVQEIIDLKINLLSRYKYQIKEEYLFQENSYNIENYHVPWLYYIKSKKQRKMMQYLLSEGIEVRKFFRPLCDFDFLPSDIDYANSRKLYKEGIIIPLYPSLSIKEQDYIIQTINKFK